MTLEFTCRFCGQDAGPGCLIMIGEDNAVIPVCLACEEREPWIWQVADFQTGTILGVLNFIADDFDRDKGFIVLRHGGESKSAGLDMSRERPTLLVRCDSPADITRWSELLQTPEVVELEKFGCAPA